MRSLPREASGKIPRREFTPEQVTAIIERRARGESYRVIGKAEDIPHTSAAALLKRPENTAEVERLRDAAAGVEAEQAGAVARERKREQSRRGSAKGRAAAAHAALDAEKAVSLGRDVPAKGKRAFTEPGKGQRFMRFGDNADGSQGASWHGGRGDLASESLDDHLIRKQEERERAPYPLPIRVLCENATEDRFDVDLNDPVDFAHRVAFLSAEGFGSRQAVEAFLRSVAPGESCIMRYTQRPPDDHRPDEPTSTEET